jgi:hypothetical protein
MSRNGVVTSAPFSTMRILPGCSTTNKRASLAGAVRNTGDESPVTTGVTASAAGSGGRVGSESEHPRSAMTSAAGRKGIMETSAMGNGRAAPQSIARLVPRRVRGVVGAESDHLPPSAPTI